MTDREPTYICPDCRDVAERDGLGLYCRTCQQDVPYPVLDADDGDPDD